MLRGVIKKIREPSRLLGTWYLAVFQKKLGTKLFIFSVKKCFHLFIFYLVLALESISGVKSRLFGQTTLNIIFGQKLSNYHISPWRKVFFSIFNQFFFHLYQSFLLLRGVTNKNCKRSHLLGTWYLAVFQKKLGTKLFIFRVKKNFNSFFFYLVLALESISGGKSRLFSQTTLNKILSQKLSNCHISLWRKVFFSIFNQFFFHSYQSCPMLRGVTKKIREPSRLLGTWYLAVFQKKLETKLFIFRVKKKIYLFLFLLSFGPRVHFRG
jgi:hypothetical protein